jgi:Na+-transporting methylmalonyl-CoA/oxaloacetate decarboxylase gamma subunit
MTQVTLTSVLVFGFVMVVLCCIALAVKLVGGPRRRRGSLMSLVIIVVVVWRLSDFLTDLGLLPPARGAPSADEPRRHLSAHIGSCQLCAERDSHADARAAASASGRSHS